MPSKLKGRIQELRGFPTLGFTTFIDTAQISALERKLDDVRRARGETPARIAFLARELEGTLFNITHEGSERIIAEHERRIAEIEALRAADTSNAEQVIAQSAAVRDALLAQLRLLAGLLQGAFMSGGFDDPYSWCALGQGRRRWLHAGCKHPSATTRGAGS